MNGGGSLIPRLAVSKIQAAQSIKEQIDAGVDILNYNINSEEDLDEATRQYSKWWDYCRDLLKRLSSGDQLSKEFSTISRSVYLFNSPFQTRVKERQKMVREHVTILESILGRLEFFEEPVAHNTLSSPDPLVVPFPRLESIEPVYAWPRFRRRPVLSETDAALGFVLMPIRPAFDDVLKESIRPAVTDNGLECQRADDIHNNEEIMEDVWERIWECRIVIADLTDDNPNVFYEVGIADTLGKNVIFIAQHNSSGHPPFDVSARRIIFYDNNAQGRQKLRKNLADMIASVK